MSSLVPEFREAWIEFRKVWIEHREAWIEHREARIEFREAWIELIWSGSSRFKSETSTYRLFF